MMCCVVPTADQLAAERLEMVSILRASYNRRSKHVFGDVQLKVTDEQQNTFDITNVLINLLEAQIRAQHERRTVYCSLHSQVVVPCVHTVTPERIRSLWLQISKPRFAAYQVKKMASSPKVPASNCSMNSSDVMPSCCSNVLQARSKCIHRAFASSVSRRTRRLPRSLHPPILCFLGHELSTQMQPSCQLLRDFTARSYHKTHHPAMDRNRPTG